MGCRVLIADDHALMRQGLRRILSAEGFEVVGEACHGFEALDKARELKPDLILMDLYMPGLDGMAATRQIRRELPNVQIIMLTVSTEESDIIEAIQAGARGFLNKNADAGMLVKQLKRVVSGSAGLSEDMTDKLVGALARSVQASQTPLGLGFGTVTQREREVLSLIAKGATNKEVAASLCISENTVRAHVRSLMQKLNVDNRTQMAVTGVREGLVSSPERTNGVESARPQIRARMSPSVASK